MYENSFDFVTKEHKKRGFLPKAFFVQFVL